MLQPAVTQQYPHVKPDLPARTRGVIALKQENCTVCYKCSRACPDWCIYIDAHKETHEPASGGKGRSVKVLDRFAIDYALCMYCGICVEVCPFDALFWSPEFEYAEYDILKLTHEKDRLEEWTYKVLPPPPLEEGAVVAAAPPAPAAVRRAAAAAAAAAEAVGAGGRGPQAGGHARRRRPLPRSRPRAPADRGRAGPGDVRPRARRASWRRAPTDGWPRAGPSPPPCGPARAKARRRLMTGQEVAFLIVGDRRRRSPPSGWSPARTSSTPRCTWS